MQFGKAIGTACASFAVTNIDDMFVLVTFFAEATTSTTLTPLKVTLGQYIGFTVIIIISMIGFAVSFVLPTEPIGFLGLLPILLGVWKFFDLILPTEDDDSEESKIAAIKSTLKVSSVTVMNGGDNIGVYIPLFSQAKGPEIAVYVVTYYILLGLWCLVAFLTLREKHVLALCQRYIRNVLPLLYLGLGMYIVVDSSCYPWTIQRIDKSTSENIGPTIMGVTTTVFLLACIAFMTFLRFKRRAAAATARISLDNDGRPGNHSSPVIHGPVDDSPATPSEDVASSSHRRTSDPISEPHAAKGKNVHVSQEPVLDRSGSFD